MSHRQKVDIAMSTKSGIAEHMLHIIWETKPENEARSLFLGRHSASSFYPCILSLCFSLHGHPSFLPFDFNLVVLFFSVIVFCWNGGSVGDPEWSQNEARIHENNSDQTTAFSSLPSFLFLSLPFPSFPFLSLPFPSFPFLSLPFPSFPFLSLPFPSFPFLSLPFPSFPPFLSPLPFPPSFPPFLSRLPFPPSFPAFLSRLPFPPSFPAFLSRLPFPPSFPAFLSRLPFSPSFLAFLSCLALLPCFPAFLSCLPFLCFFPFGFPPYLFPFLFLFLYCPFSFSCFSCVHSFFLVFSCSFSFSFPFEFLFLCCLLSFFPFLFPCFFLLFRFLLLFLSCFLSLSCPFPFFSCFFPLSFPFLFLSLNRLLHFRIFLTGAQETKAENQKRNQSHYSTKSNEKIDGRLPFWRCLESKDRGFVTLHPSALGSGAPSGPWVGYQDISRV